MGQADLADPVAVVSVVADSVVDSGVVALEVVVPLEVGKSNVPSRLNAEASFLKVLPTVVFQNHRILKLVNHHSLFDSMLQSLHLR